jgi:hypothetical protein
MKRTVWLFAAVPVLTMAWATGCALNQPADDAEPVPPGSLSAEPDAVTETFPDSLGEPGQPGDSATVATTEEVSDELQQMFGESELPEVEPESPSWDIPITINDAVERWLEYLSR